MPTTEELIELNKKLAPTDKKRDVTLSLRVGETVDAQITIMDQTPIEVSTILAPFGDALCKLIELDQARAMPSD